MAHCVPDVCRSRVACSVNSVGQWQVSRYSIFDREHNSHGELVEIAESSRVTRIRAVTCLGRPIFSTIVEQPICELCRPTTRSSLTGVRPVTGCVNRMGYTSNCTPVKMRQRSATRPFSLLVLLASLGLAFCVFAWGLQYKLSLYDPPQAASHKIPEAKLMSGDERSEIAESPVVVRTKTSTTVGYTVPAPLFFIFPLLALSIPNPRAPGQWKQPTSQSRHLRRGLLDTFFVRPPPFLA